MRRTANPLKLLSITCLGLATIPAAADTQGRQLAAACAGCHLLDSKAPAGSIPPIAGLAEHDIVARMLAYRADEKTSQVMHVIAGALSPDEIAAVAHYVAAAQ